MKTFRLLTFLLVMMGCSFVANARPAIFHLFINGDTIEYAVMPAPNYKPLINLPAKDNAKYLSGIVMASPSEIATAKVQFTEWVSTLNYVVVLMDVDYEESGHDTEKYVITYKHERGIIDGAMVYRYYDLRLALAQYKFPNMETFYFRPDTESSGVTLDKHSFTSEQAFSTTMGSGDEVEWGEYGKMTMEYGVNAKGMITRTVVKKLSKQGYRKDKDETTGIWKMTDYNEFKTLGEGLKLVDAYTLPASSNDIFAKMEEALVAVKALKADNEIMGNEKCAKMVEYLNAEADQWVKNIVYRDPEKALKWMKKNKASQLEKTFKESIEAKKE